MMMPALSRSRQRGLTLIEVLVTIAITAFGLLGVAGLLARSSSLANASYTRTAVTQKIYALADRMRTNPRGVADGNYNAVPATCPAGIDCGTTTCNAAQMAAYDLCQWSSEVSSTLPGGKGLVAPVAGAPNVFTVTVNWRNSGGDPNAPPLGYSLNVQP